ncbi:MAG TPA: DUF885 domain-containing protein [Vicinamibacterales bacterium]|jgi:hypothetical protein
MRTLLLVCLLSGIAPGSAWSGSPDVQTIVHGYIERYFSTYPSLATQAGRHDFDTQLEDLSPVRRSAWLRFNRDTLEQLTPAMQAPGVSLDDRLDGEALTGQLQREILALDVLHRPERDPLYWTSIVENASTFLLVRDDLPLADRLERVVKRTRLMPRLARQAREALATSGPKTIAPELCRISAEQARSSADFFATGLASVAKGLPATEASLRTAGAAAAAELRDLAQFLDTRAASATGSPRLSADYAAAFRWTTGIEEPLPAVLARARADFAAKQVEAAAYGRQVWKSIIASEQPPTDDREVLKRLFERVAADGDRNTKEYVENWLDTIKRLEAFVREHRIMTLPDPVTLFVSTSPSYFLSQSVGGVYAAGPYAPEAKTLYFLPVPADSATPAQAASFFRDFNRDFNTMIAAHELIPGHYTQLKYAARHPHQVRALFADDVYVEGWGTFCERLLLDEGWGSPLARLAHLKKQLENIARTIVDISVHTGGMSRDEVLRFVKEDALQGDQLASNMWMRSITSPVQLTTYYLGYREIRAVYDQARATKGQQFDLRAFMDGMMRLGPVAARHYLVS